MSQPGDRSKAEHLVRQSLSEGWGAFCRAAFWLVGFALLVLLLLSLTASVRQWPPPAEGAIPLLAWRAGQLAARLAALLLALWGSTGLLRGAAVAVDGGRPGPLLLLRFDAAACRQLFLAALLVAGLLLLTLLPVYGLIAVSGRFAPASDPLTALLVALLPLAPTLMLLALLPLGPSLTRQRKPLLLAVPASLRLSTGHGGPALVLAAVQLALLLLGSAHPLLLVGLALPLAICLGCAGERQFSQTLQPPLSRTGGC